MVTKIGWLYRIHNDALESYYVKRETARTCEIWLDESNYGVPKNWIDNQDDWYTTPQGAFEAKRKEYANDTARLRQEIADIQIKVNRLAENEVRWREVG